MDLMPYLPNRLFISNPDVKVSIPTLSTESANGKRTVVKRNYSQFEITFTWAALDEVAVKTASAFLMKNSATAFQVQVPGENKPAADIAGSPIAQGNYNAGAATIRVEGFTGTITAGDRFTIANDTKVYTALNSLTAAGDLLIEPTLRRPIATSAPLNFNPVFTVLLVASEVSYKPTQSTKARLYEIEVKEVL
ncbi:hypothetical protein [Aeromonas caviae]|uniref:hypothetical protein n=1 Tax=Aeromonas caviae TaxID=648 RepID=UPI00225A9C5C|nr:hypothetical protein [Aeromonas caviae]MCX4071915.1 hypothetical protein [Aeromonas caviae]